MRFPEGDVRPEKAVPEAEQGFCGHGQRKQADHRHGGADCEADEEPGRGGFRREHPSQPQAGQCAGRKGEEKGDHAGNAKGAYTGDIVVEKPVYGRVWAQAVGDCKEEGDEQERHQGVFPDSTQGEGGEEEDDDAEVFRIGFERVPAPVVPLPDVEVDEFRDDERGDFLRVQGPGGGKGQAAVRFAFRAPGGAAFGLGAAVIPLGEDAFGADGQAQTDCSGGQQAAVERFDEVVLPDVGDDELDGEDEAKAQQGEVDHLNLGAVYGHADASAQEEKVDDAPGFHAPVEAPDHEGKEGDDRHFGKVPRVGETEKGGRR